MSFKSTRAIYLFPLEELFKLCLILRKGLLDKSEAMKVEIWSQEKEKSHLSGGLKQCSLSRSYMTHLLELEANFWGKLVKTFLRKFVEETFFIWVLDFELLTSKVGSTILVKNPDSGHSTGWLSTRVVLHTKDVRGAKNMLCARHARSAWYARTHNMRKARRINEWPRALACSRPVAHAYAPTYAKMQIWANFDILAISK